MAFHFAFLLLLASGFDGRWIASPVLGGKVRLNLQTILDLKIQAGQVTGTVKPAAKDAAAVQILDGHIDGDQIVFRTLFNSAEIIWTGRLDKNQLHLVRTPKGKPIGVGFLARK